MKLAMPWTKAERKFERIKYFRRDIDDNTLVEVYGVCDDWCIATWAHANLPGYRKLPYDKHFDNIDDAKRILDEFLIENGFQILTEERAERVRLLL